MEISGLRAMITGAAAGIGQATAVALAEAGAGHLTLIDLDDQGLQDTVRLVQSAGGTAAASRVDVTDSAALAAVFDSGGSFDFVFNNAGIVSGPPPYPETPIERIELLVRINLTSVIVGTTLAVEQMRKHGTRGVIVNTASTGALNPYLDDAPYAASKAGVVMFSRSCKALHELYGIRVNAVLPGVTETAILEKLGGGERPAWLTPIMDGIKVHQPADIAARVLDIITDETLAGDYITLSNSPLESGA